MRLEHLTLLKFLSLYFFTYLIHLVSSINNPCYIEGLRTDDETKKRQHNDLTRIFNSKTHFSKQLGLLVAFVGSDQETLCTVNATSATLLWSFSTNLDKSSVKNELIVVDPSTINFYHDTIFVVFMKINYNNMNTNSWLIQYDLRIGIEISKIKINGTCVSNLNHHQHHSHEHMIERQLPYIPSSWQQFLIKGDFVDINIKDSIWVPGEIVHIETNIFIIQCLKKNKQFLIEKNSQKIQPINTKSFSFHMKSNDIRKNYVEIFIRNHFNANKIDNWELGFVEAVEGTTPLNDLNGENIVQIRNHWYFLAPEQYKQSSMYPKTDSIMNQVSRCGNHIVFSDSLVQVLMVHSVLLLLLNRLPGINPAVVAFQAYSHNTTSQFTSVKWESSLPFCESGLEMLSAHDQRAAESNDALSLLFVSCISNKQFLNNQDDDDDVSNAHRRIIAINITTGLIHWHFDLYPYIHHSISSIPSPVPFSSSSSSSSLAHYSTLPFIRKLKQATRTISHRFEEWLVGRSPFYRPFSVSSSSSSSIASLARSPHIPSDISALALNSNSCLVWLEDQNTLIEINEEGIAHPLLQWDHSTNSVSCSIYSDDDDDDDDKVNLCIFLNVPQRKQFGPTCGLHALTMVLQYWNKQSLFANDVYRKKHLGHEFSLQVGDEYLGSRLSKQLLNSIDMGTISPNSLLKLAQDEGFSALGEMFNITQLAQIASLICNQSEGASDLISNGNKCDGSTNENLDHHHRHHCEHQIKPPASEIIIHSQPSLFEIYQMLQNGHPLIAGFDVDSSGEPIEKQGEHAHYAVICGILRVPNHSINSQGGRTRGGEHNNHNNKTRFNRPTEQDVNSQNTNSIKNFFLNNEEEVILLVKHSWYKRALHVWKWTDFKKSWLNLESTSFYGGPSSTGFDPVEIPPSIHTQFNKNVKKPKKAPNSRWMNFDNLVSINDTLNGLILEIFPSHQEET